MTEDTIDYKAVAEGLQRELEEARLAILALRRARVIHFDLAYIRQFLIRNYVVISAGCLLFFVFFSFFDTVRGVLSRGHKRSTDNA